MRRDYEQKKKQGDKCSIEGDEEIVFTCTCVGMFFCHAQVDDNCHRVFGALVVVEFPICRPLEVVYVASFLLALGLMAVDTRNPYPLRDKRAVSGHIGTIAIPH